MKYNKRMNNDFSDKVTLAGSDDKTKLTDGSLSFLCDFVRMKPRVRTGRLAHEMLVKAARIKQSIGAVPTAVDATAGLGEDSLILAAAGFNVTMFEREPVIAEALRKALEEASSDPELSEITARMTLIEGDSIQGLRTLGFSPDIVFLDPMFPRRVKSGLVKKKLQLLQKIEKPCEDEEELLASAFAANPQKIIIKRPVKGPFLAGMKPAYSLTGKTIRYDIIVNAERR
ncbi:MAG: class I SAM-dependent methyltransferase [Eubacterium sp.]|nr:class I SAM-dependent methyltransferase [Eubacterium sp.]